MTRHFAISRPRRRSCLSEPHPERVASLFHCDPVRSASARAHGLRQRRVRERQQEPNGRRRRARSYDEEPGDVAEGRPPPWCRLAAAPARSLHRLVLDGDATRGRRRRRVLLVAAAAAEIENGHLGWMDASEMRTELGCRWNGRWKRGGR